MTHPALHDMDYDQLTQLIDEATNLRTTKFEGSAIEEQRKKLEKDLSQEQAFGTGKTSVLGQA